MFLYTMYEVTGTSTINATTEMGLNVHTNFNNHSKTTNNKDSSKPVTMLNKNSSLSKLLILSLLMQLFVILIPSSIQ